MKTGLKCPASRLAGRARSTGTGQGTRMRPRSLLVLGFVFLAFIFLYTHTLSPGLLPADSGEFQLVAQVLGIAHPPGYPLYTLLAWAFTLIPVGDVTWRVNLTSAFFAALALVFLCRAAEKAWGSTLGGLAAALALAGVPTFWAQATTANIRSLTALLTAAMLWSLTSYEPSRPALSLGLFAFVFGLGVGHHGSLALLALPFAAYLLLVDPSLRRRWRPWLAASGGFIASLLILLYLPVRSAMSPPFQGARIDSVGAFLNHVLARGFGGDIFYFARPAFLPGRLRVLWNILLLEFGPWLLGAASLGVLALAWKRRWAHLLLFGGVFVVNAFTAITYRAPQTVEYALPSYVALAALIAAPLVLSPSPRLAWPLFALLFLASSLRLQTHYGSFRQLAADRSTREYIQAILREAPPKAVVLTNWHWATPLWYAQTVEGARPDLRIEYVYPQGAIPMPELWLRRIEEEFERGAEAVVVTNRYPQFAASPFRFFPLGEAFLVRKAPLFAPPQPFTPLEALFEDKVRLLGYRLGRKTTWPGHPLHLQLYWQPVVKLTRDYSFFVHLVDEGGRPVGQKDVTHPAARYRIREVLADAYRIPVLPTVPPGRYRLIAGVYITLPEGGWQRLPVEGGAEAVTIAEVEVRASPEKPLTLHPMHLTFDEGPTLVGADYDESVEGKRRVYLHWCFPPRIRGRWEVRLYAEGELVAIGELPLAEGACLSTAYDVLPSAQELELELLLNEEPVRFRHRWGLPGGKRCKLPLPQAGARYVNLGGEMLLVGADFPSIWGVGQAGEVRLRFVALKPLVRDYSVSLSLSGEGWEVRDDGTPALGAIPTLKWLRGWEVIDFRRLVPPPHARGQAQLNLVVYDAFTVSPLPILDERLARLGESLTLGKVQIVPGEGAP